MSTKTSLSLALFLFITCSTASLAQMVQEWTSTASTGQRIASFNIDLVEMGSNTAVVYTERVPGTNYEGAVFVKLFDSLGSELQTTFIDSGVGIVRVYNLLEESDTSILFSLYDNGDKFIYRYGLSGAVQLIHDGQTEPFLVNPVNGDILFTDGYVKLYAYKNNLDTAFSYTLPYVGAVTAGYQMAIAGGKLVMVGYSGGPSAKIHLITYSLTDYSVLSQNSFTIGPSEEGLFPEINGYVFSSRPMAVTNNHIYFHLYTDSGFTDPVRNAPRNRLGVLDFNNFSLNIQENAGSKWMYANGSDLFCQESEMGCFNGQDVGITRFNSNLGREWCRTTGTKMALPNSAAELVQGNQSEFYQLTYDYPDYKLTLVDEHGGSGSGLTIPMSGVNQKHKILFNPNLNKLVLLEWSDEFTFSLTAFESQNIGLQPLEKLELDLYPNPLGQNGLLNLENISGFEEYQILDTKGRIVQSGFLMSNAQLNVAKLSPGFYQIVIRGDAKIATSSFVKSY